MLFWTPSYSSRSGSGKTAGHTRRTGVAFDAQQLNTNGTGRCVNSDRPQDRTTRLDREHSPHERYKHTHAMSLIQGPRRHHKLDRLIQRDGLLCHWCRQPFSFQHPITFEHLIPHVYGGGSDDNNLVLACAPCNSHRSQRAHCERCGNRVRRGGIAWARAAWHPRCLPETVAAP